jgi:steroid 5-alpha reductase family enzyme
MISVQATALVVSALFLSLCMLGAASAARRNQNGGLADVVWTLAVGFVGAGAALWPIGSGFAPSPLEAHMEKSRGHAFAAYKARTPVFFPWPPSSS